MKVFLSHAAKDHELARKLREALARGGFDVWLEEDQVLPGENWAKKIGRALDDSELMVNLLSPRAKEIGRFPAAEYPVRARIEEVRRTGFFGVRRANLEGRSGSALDFVEAASHPGQLRRGIRRRGEGPPDAVQGSRRESLPCVRCFFLTPAAIMPKRGD
jgi:hypothetical protein